MDFYQFDLRHTQYIEQMDYDIIFIDYVGPIKYAYEYEQDQNQEESTIFVNQLPKEYLENYHNSVEEQFILYKVQMDDTLFGLELKFEISANEIQTLNNISDSSLYPGMTIKIPKKKNLHEKEERIEKARSGSYIGVNLMDEIMTSQTSYFNVTFVCQVGEISGIFTVHSDIFFFDPDINDKKNLSLTKKEQLNHITVFQIQILLKHVNSITIKQMPARISDHMTTPQKDCLVQIILQTKTQKVLYFRMENEQDLSKFMDCVNSALKDYQPQTPSNIAETPGKLDLKTIIPYYFDNNQYLEESLAQSLSKSYSSQTYIANMQDKSQIISQEKFMHIICYVPLLYKAQDWKIVFSTMKHGSSIQTLMRKCENITPLILVVNDLDDYLFGAYLSDGIKMLNGQFYGNGETFLYTFLNSKIFKVYKWTEKNNYFTLCDNDGLAVGCSDKYGLYLNQDLSSGYTSQCDTFDNEQLSKKMNFVVDRIEIWGLLNN